MPLPADEEILGGVVINPASELGKELLKWEQHMSYMIPRGKSPGNPYEYRPYPRMLYKAAKRANGKVMCGDLADDYATEREQQDAQRFTRNCQLIVKSDDEERTAKNQGWCESPQAAIDAFERMEQERGNASAQVLYKAQTMGDVAQRELAEAGAQTHDHVTDVVPVRRRGRPRKGIVAVSE